jgi:predicted dehydrogenase
VREPLGIGILGAARIADDGIVDPARVLGHRLVAVAARDRSRAATFAAARGIERVRDSYGDVIADPEVEVVDNALVNSEHARGTSPLSRRGSRCSARSRSPATLLSPSASERPLRPQGALPLRGRR